MFRKWRNYVWKHGTANCSPNASWFVPLSELSCWNCHVYQHYHHSILIQICVHKRKNRFSLNSLEWRTNGWKHCPADCSSVVLWFIYLSEFSYKIRLACQQDYDPTSLPFCGMIKRTGWVTNNCRNWRRNGWKHGTGDKSSFVLWFVPLSEFSYKKWHACHQYYVPALIQKLWHENEDRLR